MMVAGVTLPVWGTVNDSIGFVFSNRGAFGKAAAIPFVGFVLCLPVDMFFSSVLVGVAVDVWSALFLSILGVKWHRFYLLGPDAAKPTAGIQFGSREVRFFLYLILLSGLSWLFDLATSFSFSGVPAMLVLLALPVVLLVMMFVLGRVLLVFPATAVEFGTGFLSDIVGSWQTMRGNAFRVGGAIILVSLIFFMPIGIVMVALMFLGGSNSIFFVPPLLAACVIILDGICVTIASIAFDRLSGWRGGNLAENEA